MTNDCTGDTDMSNWRNLPDSGAEHDREALTGLPRWVKVSFIVTGVLILVIVAVMLLTGGQHGPARHGVGVGAPVSPGAAVQSQPDLPAFLGDDGRL
jgi:hypothetical protein